MARSKKKTAAAPAKKMFHATLTVTRAEEWCVEAETAEEARELLARGQWHVCHLGECLYVDLDTFEDAA